MNFSLADAAKKTGMSRSSMYRLVEEGKLSVTTDHRGKKVVDLSELLRVFGSVLNETPRKDKQENTRDNPVIKKEAHNRTGQDILFSTAQELEKLRYELRLKELELKLKDKEIQLVQDRLGELRQVVDKTDQEKVKLLEIIQSQTLLLAAPKPARKVVRAKAPAKKIAVKKVAVKKPGAKKAPAKKVVAKSKIKRTTRTT